MFNKPTFYTFKIIRRQYIVVILFFMEKNGVKYVEICDIKKSVMVKERMSV